jgi:hypothetical protein
MELPDVEVVHATGELRYYAQRNLIEFKGPNGINQRIPGDVFDDFIRALSERKSCAELEKIKSESRSDGYDDGYDEGYDEGGE